MNYMMRWNENLKTIATERQSGICPYCKSNNTDYGFLIVDEENQMGYGAVWCNNCHRGFHLSRIRIHKDMPIKSIPKNIDFH